MAAGEWLHARFIQLDSRNEQCIFMKLVLLLWIMSTPGKLSIPPRQKEAWRVIKLIDIEHNRKPFVNSSGEGVPGDGGRSEWMWCGAGLLMSSVEGPMCAGCDENWRWRGGGGSHRSDTEMPAVGSRGRNGFKVWQHYEDTAKLKAWTPSVSWLSGKKQRERENVND